jgi:hypothetical protein
MMVGSDGKVEPYDGNKIDAKLRLTQSDPTPIDPTKPGRIKHLTSMTTTGDMYIEAKKRDSKRAFLHVVTWAEFKPYLDEYETVLLKRNAERKLEKSEKPASRALEAKHIKDQFNEYRTMKDEDVETSHDDVFVGLNTNQDQADILTKILVSRKPTMNNLQRGDAVRYAFMGYRCYGVFFYDGAKVIPPEDEDSDYYGVPSTFKVPTEFPVDYWNDIGFVRWSHCGDFCFDMNAIPPSVDGKIELKPLTTNEHAELSYAEFKIVDDGKTWYILVEHDGDSTADSVLEKFLTTKRCFVKPPFEFDDDELKPALAKLGLPPLPELLLCSILIRA